MLNYFFPSVADNNVILGTRSGQLIMYSVGDDGAVDMVMFNKNFSKKAIVQMQVIPAEHLLFVLTDNIVHVCDISQMGSNFTFIHSAMATKGCTLFALDVKVGACVEMKRVFARNIELTFKKYFSLRNCQTAR